MCLIVDANLAARVFGEPEADFAPVLRWLENQGCVVLGGKLTEELTRIGNTQKYLAQLYRAGRARIVAAGEIEAEMAQIAAIGDLESNDIHIVALARASGARTLCSLDQPLHRDFKNPKLIANPRGSVYQNAKHKRLLRHTRSCGKGKPAAT